MTTSNDDAIDALFIVEWYVSSINDSILDDAASREEALAEVVALLDASALAQDVRNAVMRVVLRVARLFLKARLRYKKEAEKSVKEARKRTASLVVGYVSAAVMAVAACFRWESAFLAAFVCFVATVAPRCAAFVFERTNPRKDD